MSEGTPNANRDYEAENSIARRPVLKAAAASAALSVGTGSVSAQSDGGGSGTGDGASNPNYIDPIFGKPVAEGNPCAGDASEDCFEEFRPPVRPDHEIEMQIDIPGALFAVAEQGGLSAETTGSINAEAADGDVTEENLDDPDEDVTVGGETLTVADIAGLVADTLGFHYHPAGLHVEPGDVVLYSAESPDHLVAAYHEGHGRQNRVPEGVGPISSPMPPVGGYWLYRFETEGVYDLYCSPHQTFGMVHRIVVHDGEGDVPELDVQQTGRPPIAENALPSILGGLDPNIPSSAEVLESDALEPTHIVNEGQIPWADVVAEHRSG